ncbi:unnamed protein product [Phytomonas sp. Hart1]|nr:unnamed protein product [Phytomonas sp. Hart1]|eukprot:CCW67670.1 unnamed protein product [Phytomonas sp. isolate Hart1]
MWRLSPKYFSPRPLSAPAVTQALQGLYGWKLCGSTPYTMECDYTFKTFPQALDFMQRMGPICERMQHHPSWTNVHKKIHVELTTHDAGNEITQKDVDLAREMNKVYSTMDS